MRVHVVLAAVAVAAPASFVHAALLCTSRSGGVHIRDACRKSETPVDPGSLGLVGPPGPPGPALVVRDSTGKLVGVTDPGASSVVLQIAGVLRNVRLEGSGFTETGTGFYDDTVDCSGDVFLAPHTGVVEQVQVKDGVAYYESGTPNGPITMLAIEGPDTPSCPMVSPRGLCCHPCFPGTCGSFTATSVGKLALSTFGFTPPFHVEAP
jgi:hypothetical protein